MIHHDEALSRSNRNRLDAIAERLLSERNLIIASNRGPIEYQWNEITNSWEGKRGAGGVVTAMSAVSQFVDPVWVACAMTEGDRKRAAESEGELIAWAQGDNKYHLKFVLPNEEEYKDYYGVISNPLLWFLQHYMWDAPRTPNITRATRKSWSNYETVNEQIASAIRQEIDRADQSPVVMLHDYHLYLCAGRLKQHLTREAILTHFIHIPWPEPGYWGLLPGDMRESIFRSLCACNIVGFQTSTFARNFLHTCSEFLPDAEVDIRKRTITIKGHTTYVRSYPISIDVGRLLLLAESVEVREHRQLLRARCGDQTIVRIDRIEPSKNIVRGYQALDQLLDDYPEYIGRVKFLTFLVPSRLSVEEYKQYLEEIMVAAGWINTKFSDGHWQPIELFVGENYARAIAALQLYDVLLVNPVIDGMNLVAKEGAVVNENNGVIVLSEGAGAAEQLGEGAMVVSPADVIGTGESLRKALEMPLEERSRKAEWLRRVVAEEDITMWLYHQFQDIIELLIEPKQTEAGKSGDLKKMAAGEHPQKA